MNRTDSPAKQPKPFGINGPREPILATTPAGDNTASYDSGFPPITMTLKSAGGLPPKGQDMNQILYELSALCRWFSAGAYNNFDSAFATSIGGYPKGSAVISDDGTKIYLSTIDANTNNPNSVLTGWMDLLAFLGGAPIASPTFTGTPAAPTPAAGTNTTQIATTAFVKAAITALSLGTASTRNVGNGTNQIPDMSYFSASLSLNGWAKLPNGLIIQQGTSAAATPSSPDVLVTYPIPFPTAVLHISEHDNGGALSMTLWQLNNITRTAFYAGALGGVTRGNTTFQTLATSTACNWFAIGY
ncbi:gp53-like domain-containing protein [Enterobacter roggenkampii]|uniref:gp53-like domain-containing protein n=1 Tax=Enterobacter roggenkampii TaxID=1812935 RepID=UPI003DA24C80